jgi:ubiquinone/menaquinone biosynthesis C-methylase UbiE
VILAITIDLLSVRLAMLLLLAALGLSSLVAGPLAVHLGTPTGVLKHNARTIVFTEILALSIATWVPACLLVTLAAASLNLYVSPVVGMHIFSLATLLGAATLMPAGFGATGSLAILQLQGIGLSLADSVIVVSLVRLMSTDLALAAGTIFLLRQLKVIRRRDRKSAAHFDAIAREYDEQFFSHIWNHLLERRIGLITSALPSPAPAAGIGLDMGCGLGRQCLEMGKRGYRVVGIDTAYKLIEQGAKAGATVAAGDALQLPFGDASFDFVYVIGVFHHLPGVDAQRTAYREAARVLKPGGLLFVHETNPRNLLFRFYMSYIFPILKSIDKGTEWWIDPQCWEGTEDLKLCNLQYFTFLPDFLPLFLMRSAVAVERFLEKSSLRAYSVHYGAVLQKLSNPVMLAPSGTLKINALRPLTVDHL